MQNRISKYVRDVLEEKKAGLERAVVVKQEEISIHHKHISEIKKGIDNLQDKISLIEEDLYGDH